MRRRLVLPLIAVLALLGSQLSAKADHRASSLSAPTGVRAEVAALSVALTWDQVDFPRGSTDRSITVSRDGQRIVTLPATATSYDDRGIAFGRAHSYTVTASATLRGRDDRGRGKDGDRGKRKGSNDDRDDDRDDRDDDRGSSGSTSLSATSTPVRVTIPSYAVGAAAMDISPDLLGLGEINLGGNGLGNGSVFPDAVIGRGSVGRTEPGGDRIKARAIVFDDGKTAIAIATIETQGIFAAYRNGPFGTTDMAAQVAKDIPRLAAGNILIASDHTHGGPDTIGAWGGVPDVYFDFIRRQTVLAIETAYAGRRLADVTAGHSDAADLIYNQSCPEGLNQGRTPVYTGPDQCVTGGKDSLVRVLQARTPRGAVVATYMAFAAHATAGGGKGVHGDWPQYVGDELARRYGGVGIAMQGAVGRTQPCRPACSFTSPSNPGYDEKLPRKTAITLNYLAHVQRALATATRVSGPVAAARREIREPITGPAVLALFTAGGRAGAKLLRSNANPWVAGSTIMTIASAMRVGGVLFAGTPGEGYPEIAFGVRDSVGNAQEVLTLGLANDQVGYLIAPASSYPVISAQVAVNDNTIFNVSPTIGDHVMCADIALAASLGFTPGPGATRLAAYCAPYAALDSLTVVEGAIRASRVGGISLD